MLSCSFMIMSALLFSVFDVQHVTNTEVEVFMDKKACRRAKTRADGEGKHAPRHNKKARDFTHPFIHKSTLLSTLVPYQAYSQAQAKERNVLLTVGVFLIFVEPFRQWTQLVNWHFDGVKIRGIPWRLPWRQHHWRCVGLWRYAAKLKFIETGSNALMAPDVRLNSYNFGQPISKRFYDVAFTENFTINATSQIPCEMVFMSLRYMATYRQWNPQTRSPHLC